MRTIQASSFALLLKSGAFDEALDLLEKGRTHKYLRRILVGDSKGKKYRYIYSAAHALTHDAQPAVGDKVKVADAGQAGHYEVTHVHEDNTVTLKHDETGGTMRVPSSAMRDMLRPSHGEAAEAERQRSIAAFHLMAARGSDKQKARALEALKKRVPQWEDHVHAANAAAAKTVDMTTPSTPTAVDSTLLDERRRLVDESDYGDAFPGSKAWLRAQPAIKELLAFDAAHPEVTGRRAPALVIAPFTPSDEERAREREGERARTAGAFTAGAFTEGDTTPEDAVAAERQRNTEAKAAKAALPTAESVTERLTGQARHDALQQLGDSLFDVDSVKELNGMGMNKMDHVAWRNGAGDNPDRAARLLRKYKRQLVGMHGDLYYRAGLGDALKGLTVEAEWAPRGGLLVKPSGYLGTKFNAFKDIQKKHGFRWNGERGPGSAEGMHADQVAKLDQTAYAEDLAKIGINLNIPEAPERAPEVEQAPVVEKQMTAQEAIEGLHRRNVHDTIVVKRDAKTGKFSIYSAYSPAFNDVMSNKSGKVSGIFEYNPNDNHARETYDLALVEEAIDKLKAVHPGWTILTEGVEDAKREREENNAELAKPIPEVARLLAPGFAAKPYQNAMIRFLDGNDGNAIVGDEMGLGKTFQSLAWCAKENKKVIVVCPKVVRRTWIEEAHKFFPGHFDAKELRSKDLKRGMPDLSDQTLVSVNYESLEKFLPALRAAGFDTLIVDESHRAKNPAAKTTKTIQSLAKTMKHRILMSGTAVKNKKEELFTQLEMVKPGLWGSKNDLKFSTIGGAWNKMREHYLARSKKDVLKDLPEKQTTISTLYVPGAPDIGSSGVPKRPKEPPASATPEQLAAYDDALAGWQEDAAAYREAVGDHEGSGGGTSIGEYSQIRGELAMAKAPATVDMVKEILSSSDSKVLVFSESVAAAKKIAEELGPEAILHYGQQSDDVREAAKKEFQREGSTKRVFVSTRPSLAVGATLTAADKVVFNDLPWTAADIRQAEDRVHRIGQKNAVNVYWVVAEDNKFDENVTDILRHKYDLSKKINEGKQLSPEEKAWMGKPTTMAEVLAKIKGKSVGPEGAKEVAKSALYELYEMERALVKAAR
jgi:hypothetical protein